ncbi:MAG: glycosyltransferase [Actinomycetia bacterium]|nr:glycosyltransferase [Actinomycetes bacterium]
MRAPPAPTALPRFAPIRMLEVEISCPLGDVEATSDREGAVYTRAWALVRLHNEPLGIVEVALPDGARTAEGFAQAIWAALHAEINNHLRTDGMAPLTALDIAGVPGNAPPPCLVERLQATDRAPLISVIVATRDRTNSLATCLRAFDDVEYPNYEIIVVDNAPATGATADLIATHYAENPRIRYAKENHPGLGWAHNCGLSHARGEIIAFTDDDVVVDRHWLIELVRGFALGSNVGCVTGLVVPQEIETLSQYWFDVHSGFNKGFQRRVFDLRANRPGDRLFPYRTSMFGTGANMAFRAAALRAVGGSDPALGPGTPAMNGEDLDMYFRIVNAGFQLVYQPSAFVHHLHRADYDSLRHQFYTYGVGFTAYLTKLAAVNPLDGLRLVARLPAAVAFARRTKAFDTSSPGPQYPAELTKVEQKGRLYGPLAYARSRWNYRRTLRKDRRSAQPNGG